MYVKFDPLPHNNIKQAQLLEPPYAPPPFLPHEENPSRERKAELMREFFNTPHGAILRNTNIPPDKLYDLLHEFFIAHHHAKTAYDIYNTYNDIRKYDPLIAFGRSGMIYTMWRVNNQKRRIINMIGPQVWEQFIKHPRVAQWVKDDNPYSPLMIPVK
ncbi:MAG: hypothetical protein QXT77_04315 [Candidatus Methanomethylicaceae archaeon]